MSGNKRQGHVTLSFLKIDIRQWGPPVEGPIEPVGWGRPTFIIAASRAVEW